MNYTMRVNGEGRQLDVDPDMPLLWALRDLLGLTGTKYGCGQALCGACTVHLNGQVVRSCVTPIQRAANGEVTTIEGLSLDGTHALQKAWVELGVPQCGFCPAGQLMTAAALVKKYPSPSDEQIDQSMAGNLCRCGTYGRPHGSGTRSASFLYTAERTAARAVTDLTDRDADRGGRVPAQANVGRQVPDHATATSEYHLDACQ